MSDLKLLENAKKYMEEVSGFIKNNNYQLVDINNDMCVMEGIIADTSMNPYGMIHGGYLFGLADSAAGLFARVTGRKAVTLSSHIEYLHAAYGSKIKAVVKKVKDGKHIVVFDVLLYDEKNVIVVKATIDYFYID